MKGLSKERVKEFLRESNAIENVWDEQSLTDALTAWDYLLAKKELTTGVVLKTHKILMKNQPLYPNERGYFRRCGVHIGAEEGANWNFIPELIAQWCENNKGKKAEEDIKQLHIEYERIHPFVDGNGRTGRMLLNWLRFQNGFPILIIKEVEKQSYYKWFREGDRDAH